MKPTKAQAIELLDMIEEFGEDDSQDIILLIKGCLSLAYHDGMADAMKQILKDQRNDL